MDNTERNHILHGSEHKYTSERTDVASAEDRVSPPSPSEGTQQKGSVPGTSLNLINSIIGSSVTGMPFALKEAGIAMGITLIAVTAWVVDKSIVLQVSSGRLLNTSTYQETVEAAFGRTGFVICALLQFSFPFIRLVSYNIVVGDTITKVVARASHIPPDNPLVGRQFITVMATLLITLPLSMFRNITYLGHVSLVSVVGMLVMCSAMMARAPDMLHLAASTVDPISFFSTGVGTALGVICYAFVCHHTTFVLHRSMRHNTQERFTRAAHIACCASVVLSVWFGLVGYIPFTSSVQGDMMENYCWGDDLMNACRTLLAITVLFSYPLDCFGAREVLQTTFFRNSLPQPLHCHLGFTLAIVISALLLSLSTDCLAVVMQLSGIVVGYPLGFLLPGFTYIRACGGPVCSSDTVAAWGVIAFGAVASVAGAVTMILARHQANRCSHGKEMEYCFEEINGTRLPVQWVYGINVTDLLL